MAHIKKFSKAKIQSLILYSELLREQTSYENKNIKPELANLNVYSKQTIDSRTKIRKLWDKNEGRERDNIIKLAGIAVTLPKQLENTDYEYQVKILTECNNFLCNKVKAKQADKTLDLNVGYQIHFDEHRVHLHSQFVPLDLKIKIDKETEDVVEEYYGFAFKEIFDRTFYKTMHQELEKHMKMKFPELEQYDDLFVSEEIDPDTYLDEDGYNIGNSTHWEYKKSKDKLFKEIYKAKKITTQFEINQDKLKEQWAKHAFMVSDFAIKLFDDKIIKDLDELRTIIDPIGFNLEGEDWFIEIKPDYWQQMPLAIGKLTSTIFKAEKNKQQELLNSLEKVMIAPPMLSAEDYFETNKVDYEDYGQEIS